MIESCLVMHLEVLVHSWRDEAEVSSGEGLEPVLQEEPVLQVGCEESGHPAQLIDCLEQLGVQLDNRVQG